MGVGLNSLKANADVLVVPVTENELFYMSTFSELGHCPRIKPMAFIKGSQFKLKLAMCNRRSCQFCGFLWFRRTYAYYARRLATARSVYWTPLLEPSQWDAARKMVQRGRGHHVRCPRPGGEIAVFSTVPAVPGQEPAIQRRWGDPIWEALAWSIHDAADTPSKVTSDRNWSITEAKTAMSPLGPQEGARDHWEPATFHGSWTELLDAAEQAGRIPAEQASRIKHQYLISLGGDPEAVMRFKTTNGIVTWRAIREAAERTTFSPRTPP